MPTSTATARYQGLGRDGKGTISAASGVIANQPYGFGTRFGGEAGTNPEELLAAAHAACFTMALAFGLGAAGHSAGTLETEAKVTIDRDGDGFSIKKSALRLTAQVGGIERDAFDQAVQAAKAGCPLSKVLNCEITLDYMLE